MLVRGVVRDLALAAVLAHSVACGEQTPAETPRQGPPDLVLVLLAGDASALGAAPAAVTWSEVWPVAEAGAPGAHNAFLLASIIALVPVVLAFFIRKPEDQVEMTDAPRVGDTV